MSFQSHEVMAMPESMLVLERTIPYEHIHRFLRNDKVGILILVL
jgi:hypothetical protein